MPETIRSNRTHEEHAALDRDDARLIEDTGIAENLPRATDLGEECARAARAVSDEVGEDPSPGDWEHLEDQLGRRPTSEESAAFERAYAETVEESYRVFRTPEAALAWRED